MASVMLSFPLTEEYTELVFSAQKKKLVLASDISDDSNELEEMDDGGLPLLSKQDVSSFTELLMRHVRAYCVLR